MTHFKVLTVLIGQAAGLLVGCAAGLLVGCASAQTSREVMEERSASARPRIASYGADTFYLDNKSPADRDYRGWDFFYKHCKLMGRDNAPPNKADWDCTDPK